LADVIAKTDGEEKALPFYIEGLSLREEIHDSIGITGSNQYLGEYYFRKKDYKQSELYFANALKLGRSQKRLDPQLNATYFLSEIKRATNNYDEAYSYLSEYNKIKDSIAELNNIKSLQELETKYQTEKKEQEIVILKSQKELAEQQKINQRSLLLGGIGLSTLVGLFFFFQYRNRQKTNKKLKELDTAKSHFFANISHEFRTPLTLIQSPIDEELEKNDLEDSQREKFGLIKRNSQRLLSLVDQLLMLSKIESKALTLNVQEINLQELLRAISSSFVYGFKQKDIEFVPKIDIDTTGFVDVDIIEKIASNLLSNALKYTPKQGVVILIAKIEDDQLLFEISNSGKGLTEAELKNVFGKFYQVDSSQHGYGIGLALIKELVQVHGGSITVSSNDDWTTFKISLPIARSHYRSNEISLLPKFPSFETKPLEGEKETDFYVGSEKLVAKTKPILLIVEDQNDMRNFIKNSFADSYEVIVAKNGKEGIDKALRHIPDIIISDIMMPEVDGLELTETLKKDQKTSHIPIVILTAKADDMDKIKGLEMGADDYIVKPFKTKLLQVKVRSLLDNLAKLREYYNHEVVLKPAIFSYNKTEEKFFSQLQNIINEKLQDSNFHVTGFCKFIGMSRMQLHRKLKATLGVTASEFLRTERLKAAKTLLENSELSISEIAYSAGFNDANYFSKSFKKLFKISPQEFKSQSEDS
jgi:signal transduction histidine kinase/DNA-binding response OmpR family regulator